MSIHRMKFLVKSGCILGGVLTAFHVQSATIAQWDFETDLIAGSAVAGQVVSHPDGSGVFNGAIPDLSGNGNHLSAFNDSWASMSFSGNVAYNQTGSTLSMETTSGAPGLFNLTPGLGDLDVGGSPVGALATWSIEASVYFKGTGGWQTFVGKDGYQEATNGDLNQASLYFQKVGDGTDRFRLNFVDEAGNVHIANSTTPAVAGLWYHLAATSDGSTLRLYVQGVEVDALDISGSANSALVALDEAGTENNGGTVPYSWSLARGMYNNGHGDRLDGLMDDVRISDVALTPDQFLNIPEPTTFALAGLGILGILMARRRV